MRIGGELPGADRLQELAVRGELLNPVVPGVDDVDVAGGVEGQALRRAELRVAGAERSPLQDEAAIGGELLDPVVVLVHDVDVAGPVDREGLRDQELAVARSAATPLRQKRQGRARLAGQGDGNANHRRADGNGALTAPHVETLQTDPPRRYRRLPPFRRPRGCRPEERPASGEKELPRWARLDSNQGPTDYESAALTS